MSRTALRRRARQRVAAERAAQAALLGRVHDLGARGDRRERQAAAERLAADEDVGLEPVVVLDRPHRAGAAHARLHLVVDVEDPVLVARRADGPQEVLGHRDEAALALDGLEHHAGDVAGVDVLLEDRVHALQRVLRS